jgi:chlorobactene glucosyltransferase
MIVIAILWAGIVAWLLIRAVTQYRHYEMLRPAGPGAPSAQYSVSVIVPARNEADKIGRCVRGLLAQDYTKFDVLIVDDNSTDHTAGIVADLACFDRRLRLRSITDLPPGWAGKPHACAEGARESGADWLCFMDADTMAEPGLISAAVQLANERRVDMLSLEPFQELGGFWERLIIPAGLFLLAFAHDLRRVNDPDCADAAANGQFILIRRSVYEAIGGHASVRDEISEDTALARQVKHSGHRLLVIGATELIRTRMYLNFDSLWEGLSKNVVEMLGGTRGTLVAAICAFGLGWVTVLLPICAWFQPYNIVAACLISAASLALALTHVSGAVYFGIPFYYGLLFPFGYTMGGFIALNSIWLRWKGRVAWKGRVYSPPAVKPAQ